MLLPKAGRRPSHLTRLCVAPLLCVLQVGSSFTVSLSLLSTIQLIGRPEVMLQPGPLHYEDGFTTPIDQRCALVVESCRRTTHRIFPSVLGEKQGFFDSCCDGPSGSFAYDYDSGDWVGYPVWYAKHLQRFDAFSSGANARIISDILDPDSS